MGGTPAGASRTPGVIQVLQLLILASVLGVAHAAPLPQSRTGLVEGPILVLDASSLWAPPPVTGVGPQVPAPTPTESACAAKCRLLPRCKSYSFCASQKGCGTGCLAYVKKYAQLGPDDNNPLGNPVDAQAPVLGFGPFPRYQGGCSNITRDAWPFAMCTLRDAAAAAPASAATTGVSPVPAKAGEKDLPHGPAMTSSLQLPASGGWEPPQAGKKQTPAASPPTPPAAAAATVPKDGTQQPTATGNVTPGRPLRRAAAAEGMSAADGPPPLHPAAASARHKPPTPEAAEAGPEQVRDPGEQPSSPSAPAPEPAEAEAVAGDDPSQTSPGSPSGTPTLFSAALSTTTSVLKAVAAAAGLKAEGSLATGKGRRLQAAGQQRRDAALTRAPAAAAAAAAAPTAEAAAAAGKRVGTPGNRASDAGWVSGTFSPLPSACEGLSRALCDLCHSTAAPGSCLACARSSSLARTLKSVSVLSEGLAPGSAGNVRLDQCVTCANLTAEADRKQCSSSVEERKPGVACVPYPGSSTQLPSKSLPACLKCAEAKGKRFVPTCITCASTPDPSSCTSCISAFYPTKICRSKDYKNCYQPEYDNPCAACQMRSKTKAALSGCLKCYDEPSRRQDCDACGGLADAAVQEQCYACAGKVKGGSSEQEGGCGSCFAIGSGPARQQCLQCVLNPATLPAARRLCAACSNPSLTADQRARCLSCVTSAKASKACQLCSAATATAAGFEHCLQCYSNKDASLDCEDCITQATSTTASSSRSSSSAAGVQRDSAMSQCFKCVVNSKLAVFDEAALAPLSSCGSCDDTGTDSGSCLACNTDPKVPMQAKSWCASCSALKSPAQRSSCLTCLKNQVRSSGDYGAACGLQRRR